MKTMATKKKQPHRFWKNSGQYVTFLIIGIGCIVAMPVIMIWGYVNFVIGVVQGQMERNADAESNRS